METRLFADVIDGKRDLAGVQARAHPSLL
jgi:hypothetical protein